MKENQFQDAKQAKTVLIYSHQSLEDDLKMNYGEQFVKLMEPNDFPVFFFSHLIIFAQRYFSAYDMQISLMGYYAANSYWKKRN